MSENSPSTPRRSTKPLILSLSLAFLLCVASGAWWLSRRVAQDHTTAAALVAAMTAPRAVFDGRTLEARFDLALEDVALTQHRTVADVRAALDRYATGDLFGGKRLGYDAFLTQFATRRFEIAITTLRDLANAAKTGPAGSQPAWQLFTVAGVLEFGRGRAIAAEPLLQQAFDLANKADALDTPEAASLHTALGALKLSRSQPADAEPYVRRASSILRHNPPADLRDTARALTHYAQSIAAQGFPEEAEPLCSEALALSAQFRRATGRNDNDQAVFEENYRKLLRERGLAEAEIEKQLHDATVGRE
jgi:tetratricopeptide (TPR) repeat protein